MNRFASMFIIAAVAVLSATTALAGGSTIPMGYNVSQGTFTEITGGTVLETANDIDAFSQTVNLPFTFSWNGTDYTSVQINGDGYIDFAPGSGGSTGNLPGSSAAVAAWYNDLTGTADGEIRTETIGTSPNQVFVIQWKNVTRAAQGSSNDSYTFQIRLNQATGTADIVYGTMNITAAVGAQIGGICSTTDEIALTVNYWSNDWLHPYTGMGSESMALEDWGPASGTTYTIGTASSADARVVRVSSPTGKFTANTSQTVKVIIANAGSNPMDSVLIGWSVNGVARSTMKYIASSELQPGDEVEVTLGTVTFGTGTLNTIVAWTSEPNGVIDQYPGNDILQFYMAPRVSGRLNLALTGNPGVIKSFKDCMRLLVNAGISGNTNIHVYNGNYDEQILVPAIDNSFNGGIVTIQNAANTTPKIVWSPSNYPQGYFGGYEDDYAQLTVLDGASVAIDGLWFTLPAGLDWGGHVSGESTGQVTIKNSTFEGPKDYAQMTDPTNSIYLQGGPFTISDNVIKNVWYGLYMVGAGSSKDVVSNNSVTNFIEVGMQISSPNVDVDMNSITATTNGGAYSYGLGVFGAGFVRNNNVIVDISTQLVSSAVGIECVSTDGIGGNPDGLKIYNNMSYVASTDKALALTVQPDADLAVTDVYNNTTYVGGTPAPDRSVAAYIVGDGPKANIVNNIFYNQGDGDNGGYAIFIDEVGVDPIIQTMDFNNHMTTGDYVGYFHGDIARNAVGNPLADWIAATGGDANSSSVAITFAGNTNLHLKDIQNQLFGSATTIPTVSTDIDGDTRHKPYMGADELRPDVKVLESPQSRYACLGERIVLVCVANTTLGAVTTYQWYKDGTPLLGAIGSMYILNNVGYPASGEYYCVVQCSDGTYTVSDTSESATILVVRNTNIVTAPTNKAVGMGDNVTLEIEVEAIGTPTDFVPSYQWKKRYWSVQSQAYLDSNVVDDSHVTGSKSSRLNIRGVRAKDTADSYVCEVVGYCGTVTSKPVRVYIPLILASTNTPIACEGGPINMEVIVNLQPSPGSTLMFRWYHGNTPIENSARITGADDKAMRITGATIADTGDYYCVLSYSNSDITIESNHVTVELGAPPVITAQPIADTVCIGQPFTLTATATGLGLGYQWFKGTTSIPGAVGASYGVLAAADADGGSYSVVVTNLCGSATSEVAEVVVNRAPSITSEPLDAAIYDGDTLRLWVEATGSGPLTYQWYHDTTMIDGATDSMYVVDSATAETNGTYVCVVSNECGADTSITVFATITVGVSGDVLADGYTLSSPVPNPAMDAVRFSYSLPTPQHVRIALTNAMGQMIAELQNGVMSNGMHSVTFDAHALNLTAGVYTYTIQAGNFVAAQQVVIVR